MSLMTRPSGTNDRQWDPFQDLQRLEQQLLQALAGRPPAAAGDTVFVPLGDISETDDAFIVELELPGVKKDDITIELAGRTLVVEGERKEKEKVGVLRSRTRTVGRFRYEVILSAPVDSEHVEASLDEGVLTIRLPKDSPSKARQIKVT